jgi:Tfp pilus assembly protein PilF
MLSAVPSQTISRALAVGLLLLGVVHSSRSQEPAPVDELAQYLATSQRKINDTSLDITQREATALEMVGTLDRAAQAEFAVDKRQRRWAQSIEILDAFNKQDPGHPRTREFQLQAAVYRWAQGRSWRELSELNPADSRAREQMAAAFGDAIVRLKGIAVAEAEKVVNENVRFRLARALADRAELDPANSAGRRIQENDAIELLKEPMSEPGLKGFAGLLKADLLRRANRLDEASAELDAAFRLDPPPPEREVLAVRVPVLLSLKKYQEAETAVRGSHLSDAAKELELVQIALAEMAGQESGGDRFPIEQRLFRIVEALRRRKTSETRLALVALARSAVEPDSRHEPAVWDILAEANELQGNAEKASELEQHAASRAEALGQTEAAAGYRLRGGGFLFQSGKYAEADALLSKVADDPKAGGVRAKAGMLRGLARGRALAAGAPGMTTAAYAEALQQQIRDFPKDPSTDEARWLLGALARASGESSKADGLWAQISPDSARWLDSRLAAADLKRIALESEISTSEQHRLTELYQQAQTFLDENLSRARNETQQAELSLAIARLNLVPKVGRPQLARARCEGVGRSTLDPLERYRSRLYRMIALVRLGPPYLEAEREAQSHSTWAEPTGRAALLDAIGLIDLCASVSDADLHQRRMGLVLRLLTQPMLQETDEEKLTPEERTVLKLRLARAYLFLGDEANARASLRGWTGPPRSASDDFLRDLADTYSRLEAYELAIDVQRLRSKNLSTGSPAWFDARYGLALAYFHAGQLKESAQLIDATAILHPELGGGTIEKKFIRLRQRLGTRP